MQWSSLLTFQCVFQGELRVRTWIRARAWVQTRDTTAGLTALPWNVARCFFLCAPRHWAKPVDLLFIKHRSALIWSRRGAEERRRRWMGGAGAERSPASQHHSDTPRARQRQPGKGFGGLLPCFFPPCSAALTSPGARLGVCRLCGMQQHAVRRGKRVHSLTTPQN